MLARLATAVIAAANGTARVPKSVRTPSELPRRGRSSAQIHSARNAAGLAPQAAVGPGVLLREVG
jgi:hypothetical protein